MAKFKVYDNYDGEKELIGIASATKEARRIIEQRIKDTDGECLISVEEIKERATNGQLKDLKASLLMRQVKERLSPINTVRTHKDMTYIISIHFEELFGNLDDSTRTGRQKRLSRYGESKNLLDSQVEAYINGFVEEICGSQPEFSELAYQMRGC